MIGIGVALTVLLGLLTLVSYVDRLYQEIGRFLSREFQDNINAFEKEVEPRLGVSRERASVSMAILTQLTTAAIAMLIAYSVFRDNAWTVHEIVQATVSMMAICWRSAFIGMLSPAMTLLKASCFFRSRFSLRRRFDSIAFLTRIRVFSSERGFSRKSNAPSFVARTAVSIVPWPEIIKTSGAFSSSRMRSRVSSPSMLKMHIGGKKKQLDFRVSTLPTLWGEKIVLRLLDKENLRLDMTKLGFEPESLEKFKKAILKPYGMVLVTGPTGSGKTNTLYSSIAQLNQPDTNIMTAEDPVEFQLQGVNQVQMKEQIGLNFAAALRAFLRQDPNIILVGEIRDFETAEIAIKAALTGHLVLSTLHTNGAPETITRLMNMGIEPFLVATSVHLICAQRLVRRICKDCAEQVDVPVPALIEEGYSPEEAKTVKIMKYETRLPLLPAR